MNYKIYIVLILVLILLYVFCHNYIKNSTKTESSNIIISAAVNNPVENTVEKFAGKTAKIPTLKLYYTNWCGWSQKFLPVWTQLVKNVKNIAFVQLDCEKQKSLCEGVPGFPYIVLEKNGKKINYNGDRSYDDLVKFLKNNA